MKLQILVPQYRETDEVIKPLHEDIWINTPINDKMIISNQVRSRSVMEGMRMKAITIDNWLKHIKEMEVAK